MKPAPFAYLRPECLQDALEAYADHADDAKILAGGQSLIPLLSMRLAAPTMLIDINRLTELSYVHTDASGVRFGALTRHAQIEHDKRANRAQPLLRKALRSVAHPTIRNRGTTVGSIVHADAAAEMPAVLRLLEGSVTLRSHEGSREVGAEDLFVGPLETSLAAGEIATEIFMPALPAGAGVAFEEISRRRGDYALCGAAAIVQTDPGGAVTSVKTGYLSVSETPLVLDLSDAFDDGELSQTNLTGAGELASAAVQPETDIHATADYRRQLAGVLTKQVIEQAHNHASARTIGGSQ
ncbi:FAD binding domain-containing protein [Haloechinothrix halophila]|uniref:FAD binding domain-containing protein n=1 Tax=Haloechinothrix halophila TaxID=1069073 RepID=UPI00041CB52D|nr:xanthine dehydrogenase family protein subunit M [Haloechinothrix halophila]